jgi:hypothetical protein
MNTASSFLPPHNSPFTDSPLLSLPPVGGDECYIPVNGPIWLLFYLLGGWEGFKFLVKVKLRKYSKLISSFLPT